MERTEAMSWFTEEQSRYLSCCYIHAIHAPVTIYKLELNIPCNDNGYAFCTVNGRLSRHDNLNGKKFVA